MYEGSVQVGLYERHTIINAVVTLTKKLTNPTWQFWDSDGVKLESLCNFSIVGCQLSAVMWNLVRICLKVESVSIKHGRCLSIQTVIDSK